MKRASKSARTRSTPVLQLSSAWAEWLGWGSSGEPLYGRAQVGGGNALDLAQAGIAAMEAAGCKPRSCVLSLSGGLLYQVALDIPALPRKELRQVFLRRAARALEIDAEQAVFAAIPARLDEWAGDEAADGQTRWHLFAMRHDLITGLCMKLRLLGVRVKRMVPTNMSVLNRVHGESALEEGGEIVVGFGLQGVGVSLISQAQLINREFLHGNFSDNPALAASLLQDIRSRAGYWRKLSRGEEVKRVTLIGLEPARAELLESSIAEALPQAEIRSLPEPTEEPHAERIELLASALWTGPFGMDLTLPVPPRRSVALAVASIVFALILIPAGVIHRRMAAQAADLAQETRVLVGEASQLAWVEEVQLSAQRSVEELLARLQRLEAMRGFGIPLEPLVADVLRAFRQTALVMSVDFDLETDGSTRLRITGLADPGTLESARALASLTRRLAASGRILDASVLPPAQVPGASGARGASGGHDMLPFNLEATSPAPVAPATPQPVGTP